MQSASVQCGDICSIVRKNIVESVLYTAIVLFALISKKAKNILEPKTCLKMMTKKSLSHQVSGSYT